MTDDKPPTLPPTDLNPWPAPGGRCHACYDSFSGPWCDNCDQWPCICTVGADD